MQCDTKFCSVIGWFKHSHSMILNVDPRPTWKIKPKSASGVDRTKSPPPFRIFTPPRFARTSSNGLKVFFQRFDFDYKGFLRYSILRPAVWYGLWTADNINVPPTGRHDRRRMFPDLCNRTRRNLSQKAKSGNQLLYGICSGSAQSLQSKVRKRDFRGNHVRSKLRFG